MPRNSTHASPTPSVQSNRLLALGDWKKEGAFLGVEYRLQVGAYWGAPQCFDKTTGQVSMKPQADCAFVAWVGPSGVRLKLVLSRANLEAAFIEFQHALSLYRYLREHDPFIAQEEQRYAHPLKPGETLVSVTQVLKHVIGKPGLMNWYYEGGLEAGLALERQGLLDTSACLEALAIKRQLNEKTLKRSEEGAAPWKHVLELATAHELSPTAKRDAAGVTGSQIHKNVMFYLQGKTVDLTAAPAWLAETVSQFAAWGQRYHVEPVLVEQTVFHSALAYAGTLDAMVSVDASAVNGHREARA